VVRGVWQLQRIGLFGGPADFALIASGGEVRVGEVITLSAKNWATVVVAGAVDILLFRVRLRRLMGRE
jgi:hypothetical protein